MLFRFCKNKNQHNHLDILILRSIFHQKIRSFAPVFAATLLLFSLSAAAFFGINAVVENSIFSEKQGFFSENTQNTAFFYKNQLQSPISDEVYEKTEIEEDDDDDDDNSHASDPIPSNNLRQFGAHVTPSNLVFEAYTAVPRPQKTALYILYGAMKVPFNC